MRTYFAVQETGMTDIMREDWDNLVILDACRYDAFESRNSIDGELGYRISPGSTTPEFLRRTFLGCRYPDTVYVSANPQYVKVGLTETFHDVYPVWETDWDDEHRTVFPEAVYEAARRAHRTHPEKRMLIHFMQPHTPFIGPTASDIAEHAGFELSVRIATGDPDAHRDAPTIWELLEQGEVPAGLVWQAYLENLDLVLPYAKRTVEEIPGKTVVTADHGNLFGEFVLPHCSQMYGHPGRVYTRELVKVPWLVVDGERREITAGDVEGGLERPHPDDVDRRLAALGYRETAT